MKVLRTSQYSTSKSKFFCQKSTFRHYCIQNVKDGIQIQAYNINNESVNHFSQFILVEAKTSLSKSPAKLRKKVKKIEAQTKLWFSYQKINV